MSREPFRRYTRRSPTSAADQNAVRQRVENQDRDRPASGGGLHSAARAGSQILVSDVPEPIWISIDGGPASPGRYEAWTEQADQGDGTFADAGDPQTGSASLPAFVPPGWPAPFPSDVVLGFPSGDGQSLLILTPPATSGSGAHPVTNNYGPYVTWTFVGPNVDIDFTDGGVVVNLGEVYFQALRVSWSVDQDDYNLDASITFLNVEPTVSGVTLTGIANGANGRLLYIVNRDALQDLTLAHDSSSSAAGNRLQLPNAADVTLFQNEGIALYYSETDACWFALDEAAGGAAPAFSGARVYNTANQTITGNGFTATSGPILFASESFDTDSYHSTVTNTSRLTAPTDGYYLIGGNAWLTIPTGDTTVVLIVYLNGTTVLAIESSTSVAGDTVDLLVTTLYHLTAGDYVELLAAVRVSTGNFTVPGSGGVDAPHFWIQKVGT